ncbi:hypothetical protein FGO68_gene8669 [Halteria grandinella]|uniref:Uncharacterized protein n=1 Tax=Halteria grandinella TaxID=5974 RepID=A0A8J8NVX1_HALGN|nr:hypothetical protein FGO68_gene8669 [Halteria grandinella]
MRIDGSENNYQHQATVLLVMNPRDLHPSVPEFSQREPDLIMTFDIHAFSRNKAILEMLKRGDVVTFNATLPQMALKRSPSNAKSDQSLTKYHNYDEESIHHIHGLDLVYVRSDGPESVGEHIHWDGRYQFNEELAKDDFSQSQIQEETQQKFQNARDDKN